MPRCETFGAWQPSVEAALRMRSSIEADTGKIQWRKRHDNHSGDFRLSTLLAQKVGGGTGCLGHNARQMPPMRLQWATAMPLRRRPSRRWSGSCEAAADPCPNPRKTDAALPHTAGSRKAPSWPVLPLPWRPLKGP
jgi:hypothetical protein